MIIANFLVVLISAVVATQVLAQDADTVEVVSETPDPDEIANLVGPGGRIFICSAGLRHPPGTVGAVHDTSGGVNTGSTHGTNNYISARYRDARVSGEPGAVKAVTKEVMGGDDVQVIGVPFSDEIVSLSLILSSETYGAEYWIDVCFVAPMIDFMGTGQQVKFVLDKNSLTYQNLQTGIAQEYFSLAKVSVGSHTVCDTQLQGERRGPIRDLQEIFPADLDVTKRSGDVVVDPPTVRLATGTQTMDFLGETKPEIGHPHQRGYDAPRVCVTRYTVSEGVTSVRNPGAVSAQFTAVTGFANQLLGSR